MRARHAHNFQMVQSLFILSNLFVGGFIRLVVHVFILLIAALDEVLGLILIMQQPAASGSIFFCRILMFLFIIIVCVNVTTQRNTFWPISLRSRVSEMEFRTCATISFIRETLDRSNQTKNETQLPKNKWINKRTNYRMDFCRKTSHVSLRYIANQMAEDTEPDGRCNRPRWI